MSRINPILFFRAPAFFQYGVRHRHKFIFWKMQKTSICILLPHVYTYELTCSSILSTSSDNLSSRGQWAML
jgi:hypothetical protein